MNKYYFFHAFDNDTIENEINFLSEEFAFSLYKFIDELGRRGYYYFSNRCKKLLHIRSERIIKQENDLIIEKKKEIELKEETKRLEEIEHQKTLLKQKEDEEKLARDQLISRLLGLCQHCGSKFKKKFLLFGEQICTKCGRKKDY